MLDDDRNAVRIGIYLCIEITVRSHLGDRLLAHILVHPIGADHVPQITRGQSCLHAVSLSTIYSLQRATAARLFTCASTSRTAATTASGASSGISWPLLSTMICLPRVDTRASFGWISCIHIS